MGAGNIFTKVPDWAGEGGRQAVSHANEIAADPEAYWLDKEHVPAYMSGVGRMLGMTDAMVPEIRDAYLEAEKDFNGSASRILPVTHLSNDPRHQDLLNDIFNMHDDLYYKEARTLKKRFSSIMEDVDEKAFPEIARAWDGLHYNEKGDLEQVFHDVAPEHTEAAKKFKTGIVDRLYTLVSGNDPRVPDTLAGIGLDHSRLQMERLLYHQGDLDVGRYSRRPDRLLDNLSKQPISEAEDVAAARLKGRLGFNTTHDLDWNMIEGFLRLQPIDNEKAILRDAIAKGQALSADNVPLPAGHEGATQAMHDQLARLTYLDEKVVKDLKGKLPSRDYIPGRQYYSPLMLADHPEARPYLFSKDIPKVMGDFVNGMLNKRLNDFALNRAGAILRDPHLSGGYREALVDYINTLRGSRGFRGDKQFAGVLNGMLSTFGVPAHIRVSPSQVHRGTSFLMDTQFISKLLLSPVRFPIINLTHLPVTLWPVVGSKTFARSVFDVVGNPDKWMKAAEEAGIVGHASQWWEEIGDHEAMAAPSAVRNGLSALSKYTESFRKVVAWRAGLLQAEKGEFSPLVRAFTKEKAGRSVEQRASDYARALVDTTQFRLGLENKPLAMSGSPFRRLASQFKGWPVSLGGLYKDMIGEAKRGNPGPLLRGMTSLFMFGGLPAFVGGPVVYDMLRSVMLRQGISMPRETGLHYAADLAGFQGSPLQDVDIFSLRDPFAIIPDKATSLLGPALGSIGDFLGQAHEAVQNDNLRQGIGAAAGFLSPQLRAGVSAGIEAAQGGYFGPDGSVEAVRPALSVLIRGLDLAPSVPALRSRYEHDISDAIVGGNDKVVDDLYKDAERRGIVLGPHSQRVIKQLTRRKMSDRNKTLPEYIQ